MLVLNLRNIEDILKNKALKQKMPELSPYWDIWEFAVRNPSLKGLRTQTALDFLNSLKENQIKTLENYFDCPITIDKLDYRTVKNFQFSVENVEKELQKLGKIDNVVLYRKDNQLYISTWR